MADKNPAAGADKNRKPSKPHPIREDLDAIEGIINGSNYENTAETARAEFLLRLFMRHCNPYELAHEQDERLAGFKKALAHAFGASAPELALAAYLDAPDDTLQALYDAKAGGTPAPTTAAGFAQKAADAASGNVSADTLLAEAGIRISSDPHDSGVEFAQIAGPQTDAGAAMLRAACGLGGHPGIGPVSERVNDYVDSLRSVMFNAGIEVEFIDAFDREADPENYYVIAVNAIAVNELAQQACNDAGTCPHDQRAEILAHIADRVGGTAATGSAVTDGGTRAYTDDKAWIAKALGIGDFAPDTGTVDGEVVDGGVNVGSDGCPDTDVKTSNGEVLAYARVQYGDEGSVEFSNQPLGRGMPHGYSMITATDVSQGQYEGTKEGHDGKDANDGDAGNGGPDAGCVLAPARIAGLFADRRSMWNGKIADPYEPGEKPQAFNDACFAGWAAKNSRFDPESKQPTASELAAILAQDPGADEYAAYRLRQEFCGADRKHVRGIKVGDERQRWYAAGLAASLGDCMRIWYQHAAKQASATSDSGLSDAVALDIRSEVRDVENANRLNPAFATFAYNTGRIQGYELGAETVGRTYGSIVVEQLENYFKDDANHIEWLAYYAPEVMLVRAGSVWHHVKDRRIDDDAMRSLQALISRLAEVLAEEQANIRAAVLRIAEADNDAEILRPDSDGILRRDGRDVMQKGGWQTLPVRPVDAPLTR